MTISKSTKNALDKGDFDTIEDEWLSHSAEKPEDLDYFVGVARALTGQGEGDRARFLLELLDDQLKDKELWKLQLKMLSRAGHMLFDVEELHEAILESLEAIHGHHSSYEMLVDKSGLLRTPKNIPKTWEKVERFRNLMSFDVGTVVFMKGKGAGRILEINLALDSFKIDFERNKGLMVGFRAAAKLLTPLREDHVLYRKLETPEELEELAKSNPPELLRLALTSYDAARSGAEIRTDLAGIVTDKRWASWWATARKHPQVLTSTKGRQTYRWANSSEDASQAVWLSFAGATTVAAKLDLFRRNAPRDDELRQRMTEDLLSACTDATPSEIFEIWFALEKAGSLPDDLPWSPEALLRDSKNVIRFFAAIQDRSLRERGYQLVRNEREDWPELFPKLLAAETETRGLNFLAEGLQEVAPQDFYRFVERVISQPRKRPAAFVWLAERAIHDEELRERSPLRFMKQLLVCLQDEVFAPFRASRMVPLVESGGTLPRLLAHLPEEHAEQAQDAISRAAGLEDYQRDSLRSALELRFAALRKKEEAAIYALPESIDQKREEFKHLKSVEIPENRTAIEEARALGDLRENFEYKSARARHEYLNTRLANLNHELSRVQPIDLSKLDTSEVRIGAKVRLTSGGGERLLTVLGPWESNPEENVISYESEIGQLILGSTVGDSVELSGESFEIGAIEAHS